MEPLSQEQYFDILGIQAVTPDNVQNASSQRLFANVDSISGCIEIRDIENPDLFFYKAWINKRGSLELDVKTRLTSKELGKARDIPYLIDGIHHPDLKFIDLFRNSLYILELINGERINTFEVCLTPIRGLDSQFLCFKELLCTTKSEIEAARQIRFGQVANQFGFTKIRVENNEQVRIFYSR